MGTVMMTRVGSAEEVFVRASDIQLLDSAPIEQILAWRPRLYREMPVPKGWHNAYSRGKADTQEVRHWRGIHVEDDRGREI